MRARAAITAVFALNGALFASIFSRLPAIKEQAGLGAGALGLALLCSMVGLLLSQVGAGAAVARFGSRPVLVLGGLAYAAALIPVALSESLGALAASFALVGLTNGALDVSMNVHGLSVERRLGRPILSTLHAGFSFGALAGAGAGAVVAGAGVDVVPHLCAAAALGWCVLLAVRPFLLAPSADAAPDGPLLARPTRALALLGAFAFCVLLAEGAVNDWVAVYLDDVQDAGEAQAALGLAAFSLAMGCGRLAGDRLVAALGPVRLGRGGGGLAAAGMVAALAAPSPPAAIAGFAAMGIGLAALFPLAIRAAAARGDAPGPSVAAISAMGYCGFLAGPPLVGGLSETAGLRAGLAAVAVVCGLAAALAASTRSRPRIETPRREPTGQMARGSGGASPRP